MHDMRKRATTKTFLSLVKKQFFSFKRRNKNRKRKLSWTAETASSPIFSTSVIWQLEAVITESQTGYTSSLQRSHSTSSIAFIAPFSVCCSFFLLCWPISPQIILRHNCWCIVSEERPEAGLRTTYLQSHLGSFCPYTVFRQT